MSAYHLHNEQLLANRNFSYQFLELQAAPQASAHELATERGETFIGICPTLQSRRAQFTDLIIAEVKTMSFVAYFLRISAQALQKYRTVIPELVVRLLKDCPGEGASHRKVGQRSLAVIKEIKGNADVHGRLS